MTVMVLLVALLILRSQSAFPLDEFAPPSGLDSPNPLGFQVDFANGLLSVEAKQELRVKLLEEIRKKTGIQFHYSILLEGAVTSSFKALPVKQALEHLFGSDANFIFRYQDGVSETTSHPVPTEVWIFGRLRGEQVTAVEPASNKRKEQVTWSGQKVAAEQGQTVAQQDHATLGDTQNDQEEIENLIEMSRASDPVTRVQGLAGLSDSGKEDKLTVQRTLETALVDQDASVRSYAIQALASRGGPEVMGHLGQALHDPDPSVRIMAIQSVALDDLGLPLLHEALSDSDETVRFIAASRLKEREGESP